MINAAFCTLKDRRLDIWFGCLGLLSVFPHFVCCQINWPFLFKDKRISTVLVSFLQQMTFWVVFVERKFDFSIWRQQIEKVFAFNSWFGQKKIAFFVLANWLVWHYAFRGLKVGEIGKPHQDLEHYAAGQLIPCHQQIESILISLICWWKEKGYWRKRVCFSRQL